MYVWVGQMSLHLTITTWQLLLIGVPHIPQVHFIEKKAKIFRNESLGPLPRFLLCGLNSFGVIPTFLFSFGFMYFFFFDQYK
jgi:hypothetical protein